MNIIFDLLNKYFIEKKYIVGIIIVIIFVLNIIQANFISSITANIIDSVEHNQFANVNTNLKYFGAVSLLYLILYSVNDRIQTNMLTELIQWLRKEFFEYLVKTNNENLTQTNAMIYNGPINRLSYAAYSIISSILNYLLTNFSFLIIICIYFVYQYPKFGTIFLIANSIIFIYVFLNWSSIIKSKIESEESSNANETATLDIFNNFDKIIYRGESNREIDEYKIRSNDCTSKAISFYSLINTHTFIIMSYIYVILFLSIVYLVVVRKQNKIDNKLFITLFTILLLYREKIATLVQLIPTYAEFIARSTSVLNNFRDLSALEQSPKQLYNSTQLQFHKIEYKNVTFKYNANTDYVLKNFDLVLNTNNKIIGLTGKSGKGKSTIIKLLIKLYKPESGEITIDGLNLQMISPEYIRQNITYVNQNSRLFDRKIIDNIMYGCNNPDKCTSELKFILKYPKIQELYKGIDIYEKQSGSLGENLSGGQRQIVNIISGLVNPSKMLILDEPTNALDIELKKELITIIKDFKKHKKCIIIITHDRDMYSIFDEKIEL
jgi:ABC-type bacteriocin/lantibiotic exporter with double-glycine peptidase domain